MLQFMLEGRLFRRILGSRPIMRSLLFAIVVIALLAFAWTAYVFLTLEQRTSAPHAHSTGSAELIRGQLGTDIKNANINIIAPNAGPNGDDLSYDLATINRVIFQKMFPDETSSVPAIPAKDQ